MNTGTDLEIIIDLTALRHNIRVLADAVAPADVMVVVKNDAYGHGLLAVVQTAIDAGMAWIGALDVPTALALRGAGVDERTRLFAWLLDPNEDLGPAVSSHIDLGVSTIDQLEALHRLHADRVARVHLKIDTGLHRNGATEADWPALVARAVELERAGEVEIVGIWTHIAEASDAEDSLSIDRFERAVAVARGLGVEAPVRHLAASAAGYDRADARFDLVRFGAFAYGLPPGEGPTAAEMGLRQVMTLHARVTDVVDTADGRRLASIALGYADGLSTRAPGATSAAIGESRHGMVAPLEVDRAWFDVGHESTVAVGDIATLWGDGSHGEPTLQEWGDATATMSEELVVRLRPTIPRRFIPAPPTAD